MKIIYESKVGKLLLAADNESLRLCDWCSSSKFELHCEQLHRECPGIADVAPASEEIILTAVCALDAYFRGDFKMWDELRLRIRLSPVGLNEFRRDVWQILLKIPLGMMLSYGKVAASAGRGKAVRAVASAIACNPVSIFIPCHRVVRADGEIGEYAGGVEAKRYLLELERK